MNVLDILLFGTKSSAVRNNSSEKIQRNSKSNPKDDAESIDWEIIDPPPLPKARKAEEILNALRKLDSTSHTEVLELAQEQLYAPMVMLPLSRDYYVSFGGPRLGREPMDIGEGKDKIDTRNIHRTLSTINQPRKPSPKSKDLPTVIFDIGQLSLGTHAGQEFTYQPTDYRVVLDMLSRSVWLIYGYYQFDLDDVARKVEFLENKTMKDRFGDNFDSAKLLSSVTEWKHGLEEKTISSNIKESGSMRMGCIAPVLVAEVQRQFLALYTPKSSEPVEVAADNKKHKVKKPAAGGRIHVPQVFRRSSWSRTGKYKWLTWLAPYSPVPVAVA